MGLHEIPPALDPDRDAYSLNRRPFLCTAAAVLGHNFPSSPWYQDAYKLVQTSGSEPRENKDSWISKAFKALTLG